MKQARSVILVVLCVGLLSAGVYLGLLRNDPDARMPADSAEAMAFVCPVDGHTFTLTPTALREALKNGSARAGTRVDRQGLLVRCPRCSQLTARRAGRCPRCGSWKLQDGPCPQCDAIRAPASRPVGGMGR